MLLDLNRVLVLVLQQLHKQLRSTVSRLNDLSAVQINHKQIDNEQVTVNKVA